MEDNQCQIKYPTRPLDRVAPTLWQPTHANQNLSLQMPQGYKVKTLRTTIYKKANYALSYSHAKIFLVCF